jgi:hypothetical protein
MRFENNNFTNCRDLRLGMSNKDLLLVFKQTTLQLFEIFDSGSQAHTDTAAPLFVWRWSTRHLQWRLEKSSLARSRHTALEATLNYKLWLLYGSLAGHILLLYGSLAGHILYIDMLYQTSMSQTQAHSQACHNHNTCSQWSVCLLCAYIIQSYIYIHSCTYCYKAAMFWYYYNYNICMLYNIIIYIYIYYIYNIHIFINRYIPQHPYGC